MNRWRFLTTQRVLVCLIIFGLIGIAVLTPSRLPYSDDEFLAHHQLGCVFHPEAVPAELSQYQWESCDKYDLFLPGTSQALPLRSYGYVGSLPGLLYAPFWFFIYSPVSIRIQGLAFLLVAIFLMARLLRARILYVLVASLIFPFFTFSFIIDTGPVALSIISLLSALLLIRRGFEAKQTAQSYGYFALAGFISFLGFWTKPVFYWWLPAIMLYIALRFYARGEEFKESILKGIKPAVMYLVGFAPLAILLLLSVDRDGQTYMQYLAEMNLRVHNLSEAWKTFTDLAYLLWNGSYTTSVAVVVKRGVIDFLPLILTVGLGTWWIRSKHRLRDRRPLFLALSFLSVLVFAIYSKGWATHHLVLAATFLIAALALVLSRLSLKIVISLLIVTSLYWASVLIRLPSASIRPGSNPAKDRLVQKVLSENQSIDTALIHFSWGSYYMSELFSAKGQNSQYYYAAEVPVENTVNSLPHLSKGGFKEALLIVDSAHQPEVQDRANNIFGAPIRSYADENWFAYLYNLPTE